MGYMGAEQFVSAVAGDLASQSRQARKMPQGNSLVYKASPCLKGGKRKSHRRVKKAHKKSMKKHHKKSMKKHHKKSMKKHHKKSHKK